MKTRTQINPDGSITLTPIQRSVLQKSAGKSAFIVIDEEITQEIRRFFEGAVVPYFFYQNPRAGWTNFRDCREALKLEYNPLYIIGIDGEQRTVPKSTTGSKRAFTELLERVQDGFMQNGYEFPDSEQYRQWRDSAVGVNEVYPPLVKLKEKYLLEKEKSVPVWHRD